MVVFEITGNYSASVKKVRIIKTRLISDSDLLKLIQSNFDLDNSF